MHDRLCCPDCSQSLRETVRWGRALAREDLVVRVPGPAGQMQVVAVAGDATIEARCPRCHGQWLVDRDAPLAAA